LRQVISSKYGRLISDSGAGTGSISDSYAYIVAIHDMEISIDGCHPNKTEVYKLCDGIVAVDVDGTTILLGIRSVPLIANSVGLLMSELQVRAHGVEVDSKPRCFGGSGLISLPGNIKIPLYLEHGLITCPIRKPDEQELENLTVHWLNGDQLWNQSTYDETCTMNTTLPRGYFTDSDLLIHLTRSSAHKLDLNDISRFFLYRPNDIIAATLEVTTRLATKVDDTHMRRHFKSRFPMLNRPRLQETYATDTWFASITAVGGYTCAQLFYGLKSRFIVSYLMKREADGPKMLEDFVRDHGARITLRSDNSRMQCSQTWTDICRKYCISQAFTEPFHPHQNPAERYIGEVKRLTLTVIDRTGAPDVLWGL